MVLCAEGIMSKISDAQKRASIKYDNENTVQVKLKLNKKTDADIIAILAAQENVQGFIKKLIRDSQK